MSSEQRYEICKGCEFFNAILKTCTKCGCFMPMKVEIKSVKCPAGKW